MKYITALVFFVAIGLIVAGVYCEVSGELPKLKNKFYGFGTLALFFIAMPLFLILRRNKLDLKKYDLKNFLENIEKEKNPRK
ncbi:hypothetical protein [Ornithobacterium rhinotracheale]|uniref:hypothetical protein n=1 Tax=Ornithobacterium rhinotracheale TaxID=28251 RepID=UPI001FF6A58E|nr:hypothetical protein [Ornithobacterium rhinotracheale]MCK0204984.1 hypothetical protein [Ornithobacterium rhinotracheale]